MQFALRGWPFFISRRATMLKGLAITPPVLGRISIGKVIEKNGKRLPEKDDQFTITSQVQSRDGWLVHPLNDELRQGKEDKLRSIPVRLLFNEPELNFRADYTLFDRPPGLRRQWRDLQAGYPGRHAVTALPFTGCLLAGQRRCLQALRPAERGRWR